MTANHGAKTGYLRVETKKRRREKIQKQQSVVVQSSMPVFSCVETPRLRRGWSFVGGPGKLQAAVGACAQVQSI